MKALVLTRHGAPKVLQLQERPRPEPLGSEVRIRVRFAGVNFADVQARVGLYPDAPRCPTVLGYEVCGDVDGVGPEVTNFKIGDRAVALTRFQGQAEQVCVPQVQVQRWPEQLSYESGAALPVNFLTAHHLLHQVGRVRHGEAVLIHQAAGGVGTAAIQLGKLAGIVMFGTASAAKHPRLKALGLQHPIDYRTLPAGGVQAAVEAVVGKRAIQLVIDPIGPQSWKQGYALLRPGGQLQVFGFSAMVGGLRRNPLQVLSQILQIPKYSPLALMGHNRSVGGVNIGAGTFWRNPKILGDQFEILARLASEKAIAPIVDKVFPAAEAPAAHAYLQSRLSFGKVLLAF